MEPDFETRCREVFEGTAIVRRPLAGIVTDYHELPYILIGPNASGGCTEILGCIKVSPRLVITPRQILEQFGEIFEDEGFMDSQLQMRHFRFAMARDPSRQIRNGELHIQHIDGEFEARLEAREDELAKMENVRTSLLSCPDPKLYPISLERFIQSILHREFT
ncbi:MAG: hypothetical protein RL318_2162 [Fibrobacterota bacterium]|jgi:hypothetical protein